jgi:hypothetical protein
MDAALAASDTELPKFLRELHGFTENMIDSYTQPIIGLSEFARHEPDTVRQMFFDLYAQDGGDLAVRQEKVETFLRRSHRLRDQYFPGSYLYNDDFHSVTSYLALYDPDNNYIYKATQAQQFADCIAFWDDWGSGDRTKLAVYYRMCDQVVQEILKNEALVKTDASRFEACPVGSLYPDQKKHLLVFDLIYCCSYYGLYHGIAFERATSKEKKLYLERRQKAEKLAEQLSKAKEEEALLSEARAYLMTVMGEGSMVVSKAFGAGTILDNTGTVVNVQVASSGETKRFGLVMSVVNGLLLVEEPAYKEKIKQYVPILRRESSIEKAVREAQKALEPYIEYLQ